MKLKTYHKDSKAEFFLRTFNMLDNTLSLHWENASNTPKVLLGVFDLWDTQYALCKGEESAKFYMQELLEKVMILSTPSFNDPIVWVSIANGPSKELEKLKA